jgi:hypothetical protein
MKSLTGNESLTEMKALIDQGNPEAYSDEPVYDESLPSEGDIEVIQAPQDASEVQPPEIEGEQVSEVDEESEQTEDLALKEERERVDTLTQDFENKEAQTLADTKVREAGLLKQVEEARTSKEKEETFFFEENEEQPPKGVDTPEQAEVADTTDADWETRFTQLEDRQRSKELEDASIRAFDTFWGTEKGKELRPKGIDADRAIKELDNFYSTLMGHHKNNEKAVMRTLYDLRNPDTAAVHSELLQQGEIEVPEQFDKLYDNWAVRMYSDGVKLDPVLGGVTRFREGKLESFEDAYFLMNKDKLLFEAGMKVFDKIKAKRREHTEAATVIDPSQTASFADSGKLMDANYRTALLTQMREAGVKPGSKDLSMIKDPDLRNQAEQLMKFL